VPTYIFLDKTGIPVQSIIGYMDKKKFGPVLDYMAGEFYKNNITFKQYEEKNNIER
jgi:thioredoxin-related protein